MKQHAALIYEEIMRDMSDGVMMVGLDGIIDAGASVPRGFC